MSLAACLPSALRRCFSPIPADPASKDVARRHQGLDQRFPSSAGLTDTGSVAIGQRAPRRRHRAPWRRDFENGIVLVNPTPEALSFRRRHRRSCEIQADQTDPRRPGARLERWVGGHRRLWLPQGDGVVLLAATVPAPVPSPVAHVTIATHDTDATLTWPPAPEYAAGYLVRYGESSGSLTRRRRVRADGLDSAHGSDAGHDVFGSRDPHDFLVVRVRRSTSLSKTTGMPPERPVFTLSAESPALAPAACKSRRHWSR